jgi:hypothetical protein
MEENKVKPGVQRKLYRKQRWTTMRRPVFEPRVEPPIIRVKSDIKRSDRFIEIPEVPLRNDSGGLDECGPAEQLRI